MKPMMTDGDVPPERNVCGDDNDGDGEGKLEGPKSVVDVVAMLFPLTVPPSARSGRSGGGGDMEVVMVGLVITRRSQGA